MGIDLKKELFGKIASFVETHFKSIVVSLLLLAVLSPFAVWLTYSVFPARIHTDISADGMLSYVADIINGLATLFVTCIAIYQSKKVSDLNEELAIKSRQNEIKPCLRVSLQKETDNCYTIHISNASSFPAIGVYLFEYSLFPIIRGNKDAKRTISIGNHKSTILAVDESYVCFTDYDMPKEIYLVYGDADNNIIGQTFRYVGDPIYEVSESEYL